MAKHMVKCFYCGQIFDASTTPFVKPNARRYAHKSCAQSAEENKTEEERDKEILEDYIKNLFNISSIPIKIRKQIETYITVNNYTYNGIYHALKYFYDVKHGSIEKANGGIGIVPYIYDSAFIYWRAIWEAQQQNENVEVKDFVLPVREIHISSPKRQPMKHLRRVFTFLEEEDGE